MFDSKDLRQFEEAGISQETVSKQLEHFRTGFPYPEVIAPATPALGIKVFSEVEREEALKAYADFQGDVRKFVPASGAATRMFKDLFDARLSMERGEEINADSPSASFFENIGQFPFFSDLINTPGFVREDKMSMLSSLLDEGGLNYGSLPKGLLKFHKYGNKSLTPFEEHLQEAARYAANSKAETRITFSVSPEHLDSFKKLEEVFIDSFVKRTGIRPEIEYTLQKKSTDTIAVDMQNMPFRKSDGLILFRPGGHGALIENLNEIREEVVFIKNIDNISREENSAVVTEWKKILAGKLILLKNKISSYLTKLDGEYNISLNEEIASFLEETFCIKLPSLPEELYKDFLIAKLNRPVRICGMVKNTGEPGGGPFIVKDADGSTSLQILESAQIDLTDPKQKSIFTASTHFNPVDLVCSIRDYQGKKFDLRRFVDEETGFISNKSYGGRPLKALELPGLWNGAMSNWNTMFAEVPAETFNPVKTIFDLLRDEHREH